MFISELSIRNFRSFGKQTTVLFNEGTNIIIGQNNAGKTTIIKALSILFDNKASKKLSISDFNRNASIEELRTTPPKVIISAKLLESESEDKYSDELITVSTWLTKIDTPYEATITYEFFLPETEIKDYENHMGNLRDEDINGYWKAIEHTFLRRYVSKIYVGNPEFKNLLQPEDINRFSFQFLTAIRDVERDLYKGNNNLLKEVIDFFMDYDIKNSDELDKEEKSNQIRERKLAFSNDAKSLIKSLQTRMKNGEKQILKYVESTGAGIDNSTPIFDGSILDTELYSALRLIVKKEAGIKLPAINNGLGYNNLIYISLLLSKMQKDASGDYLGANAKVFSMLAIEEPEAHLHPSMQYKFLKFLKENRESEVNQIFITSHSPNITAAVDLDDIIVVQRVGKEARIAYPGKVFKPDDKDDEKSKNYVKRFIDVTKADLFFAQNIIMVEGIAEQLLVPEISRKMGVDLTDNHTSIINIGGRYFNHFLKLFDTNNSEFAVLKKVACITDLDPVRKEVEAIGEKNSWKSCLPLFLNKEQEKYEYKPCSNQIVGECTDYDDNLIGIYSQENGESSTFEYDLILHNPTCELLITESVSNASELTKLMKSYKNGKSLNEMVEQLGKNVFKTEVKSLVEAGILQDNKKTRRNLIASRYLISIKKGEVAQELASVISLEDNNDINPPNYIKKAVKWICKVQ